MKIIGLIPARAGSKRIPGKNMALLNGKPLLQYAIESALDTRMFEKIVVSTNWDKAAELAGRFKGGPPGTHVETMMRPDDLCTDTAHDYQWVKHALDHYHCDIFAILRPTNPFRTAQTIRNAFAAIQPGCDSVRAIEKTSCHPYKSWIAHNDGKDPVTGEKLYRLEPFIHETIEGVGAFDHPTQLLPEIYVQNACIQISYPGTLEKFGNVTGDYVIPYFTEGIEGFDINQPENLAYAEWIMKGKP